MDALKWGGGGGGGDAGGLDFWTIFTSRQCCVHHPGLPLPPLQVSYMINAWARMCKIIGQGFVRYLPVVMTPLIQAASLKPEIAFVDCK